MGRITGRWGWWFLLGLPLLAFLIAPIYAITLNTFRTISAATPEFGQAVRLSFETSLASIVLVVLFGTPLAFLVGRYRFPLYRVVGVVVDLPVVLPPAAAGIGLLLAFGRHGVIPTSFGFTTVAVVMAQTFVASPFYVRAAIGAFSRSDREAEESAAIDGAGPLTVFGRIVAPESMPILVGGAITSWARAVGEFGATILFAGNLMGKTQTMPLAIYLGFETDLGSATRLSGILLGTAFISIILVRVLSDRTKTEAG